MAAAAALLVLTATASAHEGELHERLRDTNEELERAREGLDSVTEQVADAREQLAMADRQVHDLEVKLRAQEQALADAEAAYAAARERTAEATTQLEAVTQRLTRAQNELVERQRRFDHRVAAAYKYGTVSYAEALIGASDVADFLNTVKYVRSVMGRDRTLVDDVTATAREIAADRAEADALRDRVVREEGEAARARADVEARTEEVRQTAEVVAAERQRRDELVRRLEATREDYEDLVDSLESESAALAEELRRSQQRGGTAPGKGGLYWPTNGVKTSNYGYRVHPIFGSKRLHAGVDISGRTGQAIIAAAAGTVVSAGWRGGYGLAVVIDHGGGMATLYAHQSSLSVSSGQWVEAGQKIGEVGSTGYSTGPHLHFEVRVNGEPRDPMGWF